MLIYHALLLPILGVLFVNLVRNLSALKGIDPSARPDHFPFVSVLIPARNEEKNIARCLESLTKQTYPFYEILVLDDQSEDRTFEMISAAEQKDDRIHSFRGNALPSGWHGKAYACSQLAFHARGELLLFTDADTVHRPGSVASSVAALQKSDADLLSIFTQLELKSFWENLILPLLYFVFLVYVSIGKSIESNNPFFALGNGQFLLFRRQAYEAIGGHTSVQKALVEDIWIAKEVKKHGFKTVIRDGSKIVSCRMYRSLNEIWEGFSKNTFALFEYSIWLIAVGILFSLFAYVLPYFIFTYGILVNQHPVQWVALPAVEILTVLLMRLIIWIRFKHGLVGIFGHAFAVLMVDAIALNSISQILTGKGAVWKGRSYLFNS